MAVAIAATLAIINAVAYAAAIWGFRASKDRVGEATWWFLMGFGVVAGAIMARGLYWDVALPLFRWYNLTAADAWASAVSGRGINIAFSAMKLFGIFCVLKCRQLLIPEEERKQWPLWKAWMHPNSMNLFWWWKQ